MDREDKFPDLFPDLIYTLLLQLSSSRGPEAASPILKTWRLIHTGTLPEEINLQRHGAGGWRGSGSGLDRASGCLSEVTGLPRVVATRGPRHPLLVGRRSFRKPIDHTHNSPLLCPARCGVQSLRTRSLT